MKKIYDAPDLEIVRFSLKNVILSSPTEDPISEVIDPGNPDDPINMDDL